MWIRLPLAALAITAVADGVCGAASPPPAAGAVPMPETTVEPGAPPFRPVTFAARGDRLDAWCTQVKSGAMVAICGDAELRALAVERLAAFNEAVARLAPEQQKTLAADQNGWALSAPQGCGLWSNVLPSLPLSPEVRACMAAAGRARLDYLRNYGLPEKAPAAAPPAADTPAATRPAAEAPAAAPQPSNPPGIDTAAGTASPPTAQTPAPQTASPAVATPTKRESIRRPTGPAVSLSGFQGIAAFGAIAIASIAVGVWLWAALRNRRGV